MVEGTSFGELILPHEIWLCIYVQGLWVCGEGRRAFIFIFWQKEGGMEVGWQAPTPPFSVLSRSRNRDDLGSINIFPLGILS